MKNDYFSPEILDRYIDDLKKISSISERTRKSQFIVEWLDWLRLKGHIASKDYELARSKLMLHTDSRGPKGFSSSFLRINAILFWTIILGSIVLVSFYYYIRNNSAKENVQTSASTYNMQTIPYKGKLLDDQGLPVVSKKDITFRIYTSPAVGEPLYTGACKGVNAIEPDYSGSFTVVLGSDCGMSPIPATIFQTHKEIYLGVQLGSEIELTPRQKISTSGYSSDAAKLQGLSLGAEKGSIPFINKEGRVIFKHDDPYLQTISGMFTIESPAITIKTTSEEEGAILLQPASSGNVIVGNGNLGIGTFTPQYDFTVEGIEPFNSVASLKNLAPEDNDSSSVLQLHTGTSRTATESTFVKFYAESTKDDEGILIGSIRMNNESVAFETTGADFAEYFETESEEIPSGYIMTLSSSGIHKARQGEVIVGVTSDKAGFIGNKKYTVGNNQLIGLVGQVDVFIIDIRGTINKGDGVAISTIEGVGVRANPGDEIVGYALDTSDSSKYIDCNSQIKAQIGNNVTCRKIRILLK